ncbi:MAG: type II toxin-antitoxin system RelE/ParE family toxin [Spirochaetales bacterium]|nr:type II toxin-antitoxin system RelE/ParE family toxin [Spirochaetales bacterium]
MVWAIRKFRPDIIINRFDHKTSGRTHGHHTASAMLSYKAWDLLNDKTKFLNEGDKIYAFKSQPNRFLSFFIEGRKIIVTNAFKKKSEKLPMNEKSKAMDYKTDYLSRIEKGTYYGK